MSEKKQLSPADQKILDEFLIRFREAQKERPMMSDEEFMAETEVSDEQYAMGLVLPGFVDERGDIDE